MMKEMVKNLSGREIAMIITSAGGIFLAGLMIWLNHTRPINGGENPVTLEKITSLQKDFLEYKREDLEAKKEYTNALISVTRVLEGNTQVMQQVLVNLR